MTLAPPIPGTEKVLSTLGSWPSFHDAEVLRFSLSRGERPEEKKAEAVLDVQVREYQARGVGTVEYELALIQNAIIRFEFSGVEDVQIEDFSFQNVIESLQILLDSDAPGSQLRVEVESIYGFGGSWLCSTAQVASVITLAKRED